MRIEEIGELARLDVKPGDMFVLQCNDRLNPDVCERLKEMWGVKFKDRGLTPPMLLVLDGGMKIGVVRLEAVA